MADGRWDAAAEAAYRPLSVEDYRQGSLGPFLNAGPITNIGAQPGLLPADASRAVVFAAHCLQQVADYRAALQSWFEAVRPGGYLIVIVPHAFLRDRRIVPSWRVDPLSRRLYTPSSLLMEVEEALVPNSYRLRWLGDDDAGYDYRLPRTVPPVGRHDIVMVLERITRPAWGLVDEPADLEPPPRDMFEPDRTRVETVALMPRQRILLLKLDHLGDFLMGLDALEKARTSFPDAEITIVVGPWNQAMAEQLGWFDHVIPFAGYPRHSGEEEPDVRGTRSAFEAAVTGDYDIAIDMRTDSDTRFLLRSVRAGLRAGLGTKSEFRFLDIFLPIDATRHGHEAAHQEDISVEHFGTQPYCSRNRYQIAYAGTGLDRGLGAMVWGPYRHLAVGRFCFETYVDIDPRTPGLIRYDIALDAKSVFEGVLSETADLRLPFENVQPGARFEFRLFASDEPAPAFQFYGGRLTREGAASVLHQSEYLHLLIELVALRVSKAGVLQDLRVGE